MDCGGCGRGNRDESAFCLGCGAKLALACPTCGRELPPDAAFCDGCGGRVGATAPSVVPKGARKVVTILFADLAGSTSMQERLDAEATARVMERVHRLYGDVVEAHGGRVVKTIGDGVMAVFGTPIAREDDAERAVRAGLALQA
ncbi:MAG TPA: adenylate/guanylate cyclase domain-containing protein, partial [Acidimicrobiales bacterium]|nr:adenylate/guanylate cyclase domain-containing protein [Acidimicrobiales bacterium]